MQTVERKYPLSKPMKEQKQEPNITIAQNTTAIVPQAMWRLNRVVCSGLGDRLCLIFAMAGLGHLANARVSVRWCDDPAEKQYDLDVFQSMFVLPPSVTLVPSSQFDEVTANMSDVGFENTEIPATAAFDCVYSLAPKTFKAPQTINASSYTAAYKAAGLEFLKNGSQIGAQNKEKYVVLHVRCVDKTTDFHHNQFCTQKALSAVLSKHIRVIVVSDDVSLARQITNNHNMQLADNDVFTDLTILYDAKGIIQHSPDGWSAFSSSIAMFRSIPLINTWRCAFNRIGEFRQRGGDTAELHMCPDLPKFINSLM
jgi:hypothetical protein